MTIELILKSLFALLAVSALAILSLKAMKFFMQRYTQVGPKSSKFSLDSQLYLDNATRLVEITNGNKSYVILLGGNNQILVDKYENI